MSLPVLSNLYQSLLILLPLSNEHFNYDSPAEWQYEFPQCGGNKQSPIAISTPKVPETAYGEVPFITGGLLDDVYQVENVHFHWGSTRTKGSEHMLNGNHYHMEMHIVHRNTKYLNLQVAQHFEDGIAVIGVLFKIVKASNVFYPGLNAIYNNLPSIETFNTTTKTTELRSLGDLLGNINREDFYTYQGSLTTPPCSEAVTWIVFADVLPISFMELPKFWSILDRRGQQFVNVRPIQNNGFRKVFHRKPLVTFKYLGWPNRLETPPEEW